MALIFGCEQCLASIVNLGFKDKVGCHRVMTSAGTTCHKVTPDSLPGVEPGWTTRATAMQLSMITVIASDDSAFSHGWKVKMPPKKRSTTHGPQKVPLALVLREYTVTRSEKELVGVVLLGMMISVAQLTNVQKWVENGNKHKQTIPPLFMVFSCMESATWLLTRLDLWLSPVWCNFPMADGFTVCPGAAHCQHGRSRVDFRPLDQNSGGSVEGRTDQSTIWIRCMMTTKTKHRTKINLQNTKEMGFKLTVVSYWVLAIHHGPLIYIDVHSPKSGNWMKVPARHHTVTSRRCAPVAYQSFGGQAISRSHRPGPIQWILHKIDATRCVKKSRHAVDEC